MSRPIFWRLSFGDIAAEFAVVKNIKRFLRNEFYWEREGLYAYSYSKHDFAEDGVLKEQERSVS